MPPIMHTFPGFHLQWVLGKHLFILSLGPAPKSWPDDPTDYEPAQVIYVVPSVGEVLSLLQSPLTSV